MARKTKKQVRYESPSEPEASQESDQEPDPELEPPTIEPYATLNVARSATADEIKSAYRKAALKHHPDKASEEDKATATATFQSIAFAYAILSSPARRAHYDATGSLSPGSGEEVFDWSSFYAAQYRDVVTPSSITRFSLSYKGSAEERADVLAAYVQGKGKWAVVYETVLLSDCLVDEARFRGYIDEAIEKGEVSAYKAAGEEDGGGEEGG
ncbi:DnaJ domain-containing protein [Diplocarpon rosae]|nr:DnaJ domain-containing protein [Diplocarpon rosae]